MITGSFCVDGTDNDGIVGSIFSSTESDCTGENGKSSKRSIVDGSLDDDDESGDGKLAKKFFNSFSNSTEKKKTKQIIRIEK